MSTSLDLTAARTRRYRQAGWIYGGFGLSILLITVASPELLRPERRSDLVHLAVGLPFFLLFALAIGWGDRISRRFQTVLTMILTLSAAGRTAVFLANGLGQRPRLRAEVPWLSLEPTPAEPRMLVNAALMAVICFFLARAWVPALGRGGFG